MEQGQELQKVSQNSKDFEYKYGEMKTENKSLHQQIEALFETLDQANKQLHASKEATAKKDEVCQDKAQEIQKLSEDLKGMEFRYELVVSDNESLHQ